MTSSRLNENELEIQMQKRIAELERSNQDLRAEILQCKQKEHKRYRSNLILQGINLIFGSFVKAETEEELGNKCLSVALAVTGEGIGFVGEVGADGILHDIAISDMGWNQCFMYDKTGHRRPPGDFVLHGFYGRIVDSGKSFFTNDPLSHPDSVGLPEGHPPLTSFLGVPLILGGKIMGILAVGNRENGYSFEQQEDLEAIAPAVVQVLQRKREEQEREKAEKVLHDSEERYRSLYENSLDGILLTKPDGTVLSANPQACKLFGMTDDDILQAGREGLVIKNEVLAASLEERELTGRSRAELTCRRKDGSTFSCDVTSNLFKDADGSIKTSMIIRDITERKHAEKALKKAYDNLEEKVKERTSELEKAYNLLKESERGLAEAQKIAHIGNWDWDFVTGKVYWSDELYSIFGRNPQESGATYDELLQYLPLEDRGHMSNAIKKALNEIPHGIDYRIILPDGEERTVHGQTEVIFNQDNIPVRAKGTVQNITERKKAEKALEKVQETHIKEIHHRIKNNLQIISSLLSLESEKFSDEKMLESFRKSQNRVASMALIHEELYKGNELDTLDFAAYLQKLTADLFGSYNLSDDISLKLDLEEIHLGMDTAIPLGIIVNELISNSLKHAFPAGRAGEIHINLYKKESLAANYDIPGPSCKEKKGFHYVLTVEDNGKGISEDIEFQNADSLGLQLVNILVEQIDGCIELKRNHGTKFTIWFSNLEP